MPGRHLDSSRWNELVSEIPSSGVERQVGLQGPSEVSVSVVPTSFLDLFFSSISVLPFSVPTS